MTTWQKVVGEPVVASTGPKNWVFYPKLHLLFGAGDEQLIRCVPGIAQRVHWWIQSDDEDPQEARVMDAFSSDAIRRDREGMPYVRTFFREESGAWLNRPVTEFDFAPDDDDAFSLVTEPLVLKSGELRIVFDADHATLERREKRLKPEFQRKMAEFGIEYGKKSDIVARPTEVRERSRRLRRPDARAYGMWLEAKKREYREARKAELLTHPESRPADFTDEVEKVYRSKEGKITRGIRDNLGRPQIQFTEDGLVERAAHSIARREATQLAHEHVFHPLARYWPGENTMEHLPG